METIVLKSPDVIEASVWVDETTTSEEFSDATSDVSTIVVTMEIVGCGVIVKKGVVSLGAVAKAKELSELVGMIIVAEGMLENSVSLTNRRGLLTVSVDVNDCPTNMEEVSILTLVVDVMITSD